MTFVIGLLLKDPSRLKSSVSTACILFCSVIVVLRILFPIETSIVKTIPCTVLLPDIFMLIRFTIFSNGDWKVKVYHILYTVWLIVALFKCINFVNVSSRLKKTVGLLPDLKDDRINTILKEILDKYPTSAHFTIKQSPDVMTPMIIGFNSPIIILPEIQYTDEELYFILRHDAQHYHNHDFRLKAIMEFASFIYWWNPFALMLKRQVNKALEIHTDITITESMSEPDKVKYLECVLKTVKYRQRQRSGAYDGLSLSFIGSASAKQRFQAVLGSRRPTNIKQRMRDILIITLPVLVIASASLMFVVEPVARLPKEIAETTVGLKDDNVYLIVNPGRGYDIYSNGTYFATISKIEDSASNIRIYNNLKEAITNENR